MLFCSFVMFNFKWTFWTTPFITLHFSAFRNLSWFRGSCGFPGIEPKWALYNMQDNCLTCCYDISDSHGSILNGTIKWWSCTYSKFPQTSRKFSIPFSDFLSQPSNELTNAEVPLKCMFSKAGTKV